MSGDFLDTNIFVYLFDETDDRKRNIADSLIKNALETQTAQISFQVVQETLNILTRKIAVPMSTENAQRFLIQVLMPLWRVMPNLSLYQSGLTIQTRYGYNFYDSLIIAAALDSGCTRLISEDMQDGQQIGGLLIENPFKS